MTNWYVSPTGNDITGNGTLGNPYQTIQGAHDKVTTVNGDTIILMNGTYSYSANITLTKSVSLTSQNGAAVTTLQFTVADRFITFQGDAAPYTIHDITFDDINANLAVLNVGFASIGVTKPLTWPTNVNIYNNVFNTSKYAVSVKGQDIQIYNNSIQRKGGTSSISPFLIYFLRGTLFIDGNIWTDNVNPSRFVWLAGFGTTPSAYLQYINSRNGTIIFTNNTLTSNTGTTSRTAQLFIQDTWHTVVDTGIGGLSATDILNFKLSLKVTGNILNLTSSGAGILRGKGLVAFLSANTDVNGNSLLRQWLSAFVENNTFNCSGTAVADQGSILLDSGLLITVPAIEYINPKFFASENVITQPNPFVPRTGTSGVVNMCQTTAQISPANLHLQPWLFTTFTPPTYNVATDNLFLVPTESAILISGTYNTYTSQAKSDGDIIGGAVTLDICGGDITTATVSNLPNNTFKVIVGTSISAIDNSLWFFIRIYDVTGNQVTDFSSNPLTIQITTPEITGATATVKLNGTTLTTTATEVSTGIYTFQLSANSEYLIEGEQPPTPTPTPTPISSARDQGSYLYVRQACLFANAVGRLPDSSSYIRSKACGGRCC